MHSALAMSIVGTSELIMTTFVFQDLPGPLMFQTAHASGAGAYVNCRFFLTLSLLCCRSFFFFVCPQQVSLQYLSLHYCDTVLCGLYINLVEKGNKL